MEILYSIFGVGGLAILIWVVRSIKRWGAADARAERAEEKQHDAERLANRPRTMSDRIERLRLWKRKL